MTNQSMNITNLERTDMEKDLLKVLADINAIRTDSEFDRWVDRLRESLSFCCFCFGYMTVYKRKVETFWPVKWFKEIEGFEDAYMSRRLYQNDRMLQSIARECPAVFTVRSWRDWDRS